MKRPEILETAEKCVCGQRLEDYGTPEDNFATIANLWGVYKGVAFTPLDVAMMMGLLKIARIRTGKATADSFIDLAGYAACGGEIATETGVAGIAPVPGWQKGSEPGYYAHCKLWELSGANSSEPSVKTEN